MADAVITNRRQNQVIGTLRGVFADSLVFGGSDTWVVPGIKRIEVIQLSPTTAIQPGWTVSGNTLTAVTAGTFRGGVLGI